MNNELKTSLCVVAVVVATVLSFWAGTQLTKAQLAKCQQENAAVTHEAMVQQQAANDRYNSLSNDVHKSLDLYQKRVNDVEAEYNDLHNRSAAGSVGVRVNGAHCAGKMPRAAKAKPRVDATVPDPQVVRQDVYSLSNGEVHLTREGQQNALNLRKSIEMDDAKIRALQDYARAVSK